MKTRYIHILSLAIALSSLLSSCKKEIDFPYRSVDSLMVIEASVCQDSSVVKLSKSIDMESSFDNIEKVSGADVTLTYEGKTIPLYETSAGEYKPEGGFHGTPGVEYTLKVLSGGNEYSSTSEMQQEVKVLKSGFRSLEAAGYKCWIYSATVQDVPGEENYYAYYFYEDGKLFSWDLTYDEGNDGGELSFDVAIESDDEAVNGTDEHATLSEGGTATLEIRSIDKKTFNYLYSLAVTMMTYANAVQDFSIKSSYDSTPLCLGYFSAYSSKTLVEVFNREDTFPTQE